MALSPTPLVPFQDPCAIEHNGVLYVYQPNAFQSLSLTPGAEWQQLDSGVSVTGAVCVKGGTDGNSDAPALYVIGGTTNSSTSNYSGLQRYSIADNIWTTIKPVTQVTAQRINHGATYLNSSSALVVYGGSQNGNSGPSSETYLMLMYPPYNVQSYSAQPPPPLTRPQLMPWSSDRAVMVGGGSNQKVYTFFPTGGFTDIGLSLPYPLPDASVAQTSLVSLDDGSKVLLTFDMSKSPNMVYRNVLLNPGGAPASYGQTVGSPTSSAGVSPSTSSARMVRRGTSLNSYPPYNATDALAFTRNNFALASGSNEQTAIVGGDEDSTVVFYNKLSNGWTAASEILGPQKPLTSSSSSSSATAPPTSSPTVTASPSSTASAAPVSGSHSNGLAILGGVLGAVCGLAAILIIILLYLRSVRRRRAAQATKKNNEPVFPDDKTSFEEQGLQPLSVQGQPMGRSPVPSASEFDGRDSMAMFGGKPSEKSAELANGLRMHQASASLSSFTSNPFKRQQSGLTISKPMLPDLGDYQERPSIELGAATPIGVPPAAASPLTRSVINMSDGLQPEEQRAEQRKTDEGWAKYFSTEKIVSETTRDTTATADPGLYELAAPTNPPPSRGTGRGGFWPGSGVPESNRSSPRTLRDSEGRKLTTNKVATSSPHVSLVPPNQKTLTMSTTEGIAAKISDVDSISTDATDDDGYESDRMSTYSSNVPGSERHESWTPFENNSGAPLAHARPGSDRLSTTRPAFASLTTINTDDSSKSSIPSFPMPAATVRQIEPSTGTIRPPSQVNQRGSKAQDDYFGSQATLRAKQSGIPQPVRPHLAFKNKAMPDSSDMSWLNLGTPGPAQVQAQGQGR